MNVLLIINRPLARNVSVLVKLSSQSNQQRLRKYMEKGNYRDAFNLVSSSGVILKYLESNKEYILRYPEYTLIEEFIERDAKT